MSENKPASNVERGTNETNALWSEDAERAVLSAMMADASAVLEVMTVIEADDFYRSAHRSIYLALNQLGGTDVRIDPITLANELEARGQLAQVGGKVYIGGLLDEVPVTTHVLDHARIVRDRARRRKLLKLGQLMAHEARDLALEVDEALDNASRRMLEEAAGTGEEGFRPIKSAVWDAMQRIDDRKAGILPIGLKTGWPELDAKLGGGIEKGTLAVIVGVPGCGKTSMVLNLLTNLATAGAGTTALVSAEMSEAMLTDAALSSLAGVSYDHIRRGEVNAFEQPRLTEAAVRLASSSFHIDATIMPDVEDVVRRITILKARYPDLCAVGVDYIQLLQRRNKERGELGEATLRHIAYALKGVALKCDIVVFALAQPNDKQVEGREADKRPQLRDIQGSSGIRQAAQLIILLYREGVYTAGAEPDIELNIAKNTFGPSNKVVLTWEGQYRRVTSEQQRLATLERERARTRQPTLAEGAHA